MSLTAMVLGASGTGKTSSLLNFDEDEILYINPTRKFLPFPNKKFLTIASDSYEIIATACRNTDKKIIIIDDAQYLMANEFMNKASEKGYDKFTDMAYNFWNLIQICKNDKDNEKIFYFLSHTETDERGMERMKTCGKLINEKVTIEGWFEVVLKTSVIDGVYQFQTQNNGHDCTKSPAGMFDMFAINNDLKFVDERIRNYYRFENAKGDEEISKRAEEVTRMKEKPTRKSSNTEETTRTSRRRKERGES